MSTQARTALEEAFSGVSLSTDPAESKVVDRGYHDMGTKKYEGTPFHGETDPQIHIQKEKPEHRLIIMMFAQGLSAKEVFLQLGGEWCNEKNNTGPVPQTGQYTYPHITQIRKQPWAQKEIVRIMQQNGSDKISARFAELGSRAIDTLEQVMEDVEEKGNVRAQAANAILDRFLGKPTQKVVTEDITTVSSLEKDAIQLRNELEEIEQQMKSLNAGSLSN